MGIHDRDYYRASSGRGTPSFQQSSATKWLVTLIGVTFLLQVFTRQEVAPGVYGASPLEEWGMFSIQEGIMKGQVWRLLTFSFLHENVMSALINGLLLFQFGPMLESRLGTKSFLKLYALSQFGAIVLLGMFALVVGEAIVLAPLSGALAGVLGVLGGVALLFPQQKISLMFPPVTLSLRQLALILIGLSLLFMLTGSGSLVRFAPLGGVLAVGLVLGPGGGGITKRVASPRSFRPKIKPRSSLKVTGEEEIDQILDKINEKGIQSLTAREREILTKKPKS